MHPKKNVVNWQKALEAANSAKRCGAKTRATHPCKSPAMSNGRCRMHGGKSSGAPRGAAHGRYKHGKYTNDAKQKKREVLYMCRIINLHVPKQKATARIYVEDIDFKMKDIKTQTDVLTVSNQIWSAFCNQEISIQEATVLFKDLERKNILRIKAEKHKLRVERRRFREGMKG